MRKYHFKIPVAAIAVCLAVFASRAEEQSVAVKFSEVPPEVHRAIQKEAGRGKVNEIEKITDDGEVSYDVEITKNNRKRNFTVDDHGKMLELEVFAGETPAAVHAAITERVGKGTLESISKLFDDGVTYEVEMTEGSQTRDFTLDENGTLLDMQVFFQETPAAVQKAIRKEVGTGKLGDITKITDDSAVSYEVEITRGGNLHVVTVGEDGIVADRQVFLAELSPALQKNIQALAGADKLGEIHEATEDGKTIYEVEIDSANGASHYTTVNADGATLYSEEDIALSDAPANIQAAIKTLVADGELLDLSKTTEDGDVSYDLDVKKSGKQESFSLDADGKVLPPE